MISPFPLRKPTYLQSLMLIYGFFFELWVLNLKEEENKMPIIAQYIYDGEDLGHPYIQSTTVLCDKPVRPINHSFYAAKSPLVLVGEALSMCVK